jgi:plasmid stabilization system protein ParE
LSPRGGVWAIRFTPLAGGDVREVYAEYESAHPGLGESFLDAIDLAIVRIGEHPEACPEVHRHLRRALLYRFPYALYYKLDRAAEVVEIRAVVHQRRHPRSWRRRV